jgi:H+-transporting ATPase
MVIIMITGDFLGMSLTTDTVQPSPRPNQWRISRLTVEGVLIGVGELAFCSAALLYGLFRLKLGAGAVQTLAFVVLVFGNQATMYNNRERRHLWSSRPGGWVVASSLADIVIASALAVGGLAMAPLAPKLVAELLAASAVFAVALDLLKVPALRWLGISEPLQEPS